MDKFMKALDFDSDTLGNQMPSFIGFGTPEYDTKLTVKTSPRWCPRRKKKE